MKSDKPRRPRCTCGYKGRAHQREFCNPRCRLCNEIAAQDEAEARAAERRNAR